MCAKRYSRARARERRDHFADVSKMMTPEKESGCRR